MSKLVLEILVQKFEVEFVGGDRIVQPRLFTDGLNVFVFDVNGVFPKLLEFCPGEFVVCAVFQLDVEFKVIHQPGLCEVAGTGNDPTHVPVFLNEGHDVELGVDVLRRIRLDLKLPALQPLQELHHPLFNVPAVFGLDHLVNQQIGKVFLRFRVGKLQF